MKKNLIYVSIIIIMFLGYLGYKHRSPTPIPQSQILSVILSSPNRDKKTLFKDTFTDTKTIDTFRNLFTQEVSVGSDHKCASLSSFEFQSDSEAIMVETLPGHDDQFYEARYDGRVFLIDRALYIKTLKDAGISEDHIILDGHKEIKIAEQDATPNR